MKKILIIFVFVVIGSFNINATCSDNGQNLSESKIISEYNCKTGKLYIYGSNKYGALGTGDYKNVNKNNKVLVNDKIGNVKIIDYFISPLNTYILSDTGKVYATGSEVADGKATKRNSFVEIYFYKQKSNKIKELYGNTFGKDRGYALYFNVSKKVYYIFDKMPVVPTGCAGYDAVYGFGCNIYAEDILETHRYPVYNKSNKNEEIRAEVNRKKQVIYKFYSKGSKSYYKEYSNGKLKRYSKRNSKRYLRTYYKNDKVILTYYINFKTIKDKDSYKWKVKNKIIKTKYSNGKKKEKKTYIAKYKNDNPTNFKKVLSKKQVYSRYNNNKLKKQVKYKYSNGKLQFKYIYKYNKQGKLKSNKYGKAYRITIRYINNKKSYSFKQYYNAIGKLVWHL